MLLMAVVQQILRQGVRVTETLYNAVHVTCVTQVLQACESAFLRNVRKNVSGRRESDKRKSIQGRVMRFEVGI
jgi:hypothetical protein